MQGPRLSATARGDIIAAKKNFQLVGYRVLVVSVFCECADQRGVQGVASYAMARKVTDVPHVLARSVCRVASKGCSEESMGS